jgi:copper chaperone
MYVFEESPLPSPSPLHPIPSLAMSHLQLQIQGMSCDHCVRAVRQALDGLPGVNVQDVQVGTASVEFDPARVTPDQIVDAVNDEGYTAQRAA